VAGGNIQLSGLTKRFSEIAVDDIDLTVARSPRTLQSAVSDRR
jgi:hypothetical protein